MPSTNIVLIGAGSASFGLGTLATLLREPRLDGSTLHLVDFNAEGLQLIEQLARRMAREWQREIAIESSTDRCQALPGADFVVVTIETGPREILWQQDYEIPLQFGLRQPYAENGGPGGFAHAMRNIPPLMDIARDMERHCPEALLINLTNPLPRLCRAVSKYTDIQVVGLCHQVYYGYALLGQVFAADLDIEPPPVPTDGAPHGLYDEIGIEGYYEFVQRAMKKLSILSAGLNHFIWALDIRRRDTGRDLYPLLREKLAQMPEEFELLARETYGLLGTLPIAGDTHFVEYLPWVTNPRYKAWERNQVQLYRWAQASEERHQMWEKVEAMVHGRRPIAPLKNAHSEGVVEIVTGMACGETHYMEAVNVPNRRHIANLPDDVIVEVPAVVGTGGVRGLAVGDLPPLVAELCRREATLVELIAEAGVSGDRHRALQALLYDPHVDDAELARDLLDAYLEAQAQWLPQFHGQWSWDRELPGNHG